MFIQWSALKCKGVLSNHFSGLCRFQFEHSAHYEYTNSAVMSSTQVTHITHPSQLNVEERPRLCILHAIGED